jgi:hyperosmotically inducible protein
MTLIRKVLLLVCGLMLVFSLASCEKKGPAEKTGEKIDKAVEKAGEKVEKAGDKIKEKTEK